MGKKRGNSDKRQAQSSTQNRTVYRVHKGGVLFIPVWASETDPPAIFSNSDVDSFSSPYASVNAKAPQRPPNQKTKASFRPVAKAVNPVPDSTQRWQSRYQAVPLLQSRRYRRPLRTHGTDPPGQEPALKRGRRRHTNGKQDGFHQPEIGEAEHINNIVGVGRPGTIERKAK